MKFIKFKHNKIALFLFILLLFINVNLIYAQDKNPENVAKNNNNPENISQIDLPKIAENSFTLNKNSKKINKKTAKKIKKNISKKNIKNLSNDTPTENQSNSLENQQETDKENFSINDSIKNYKNQLTDYSENFPDKFIIEIELDKNCDDILGIECERSDKFFEEAYFHPTSLFIFYNKIIAIQEYQDQNSKKTFHKVRDGNYNLTTKNQNKIYVEVKNGLVNIFKLLDGDIDNEAPITSKCQYAEKLLAYYDLYKKENIKQKQYYYSYANNSRGLIELTIFSNKYEIQNYYAVIKFPSSPTRPVQNLNLCKIKENDNLFDKNYSQSECSRKLRCIENKGYSDEEYMNLTKKFAENFSYFDAYKFNRIYDNNPENSASMADNKIENDNILNKKMNKNCFSDKNVDVAECSSYKGCEDYIAIENCNVNYFYDKENLKFE